MPSAVSSPVRPLWLFATLWSLREYPAQPREWSWTRKFAAIRVAGFEGVMSPPLPELAARGGLSYLAISSVQSAETIEPTLQAAKDLGALAIGLQLGRPETPLAVALKLALKIRQVAQRLDLPFAIETHRATFTELPETLAALQVAYRKSCGENLPICLDYSHVAVVRHLLPEATWPTLATQQPAALANARQFHLRPFNGHHAQLPVRNARGRRTPEYLAWRDRFVAPLFRHLRNQRTPAPVLAVAELGHAAPAYGLSTHGDTWQDTLVVARDLRALWSAPRKG
jgi:hypothetical protein